MQGFLMEHLGINRGAGKPRLRKSYLRWDLRLSKCHSSEPTEARLGLLTLDGVQALC